MKDNLIKIYEVKYKEENRIRLKGLLLYSLFNLCSMFLKGNLLHLKIEEKCIKLISNLSFFTKNVISFHILAAGIPLKGCSYI